MSQSSENKTFNPGCTPLRNNSDERQKIDNSSDNFNTHDIPSQVRPSGQLFTQSDLQGGAGLSPWAPVAYREFRRQVRDSDYPCTFAVGGEHAGTLRYSFVDDLAAGISKQSLLDLIALSQKHPEKRHALAVFVRPERSLQSHDYYGNVFWDLLQKLHDDDSHPWPGDVPVSPGNPKWEFCFGGEPMFVFGAAPSHFLRRSRNLGPSLVLLFQPRSVFRGIEGGTLRGSRVREQIRQRLAAWDLTGLHLSMGNYGDPSNFEASQYFIPDNDQPTPPCPLKIRGDSSPLLQGLRVKHTDFSSTATIAAGLRMPFESAIRQFLPSSGCLEVQQDPAGRVHAHHTHPVNETLYVLEGELLFHVHDQDFRATAGTTIQLPAGTWHSSVAGPDGCLYLIAVR